MFGLTRREWVLFGVGCSVQGALMGVLFHSAFYLGFNLAALAMDVYLLQTIGSEE